MIKNKITQERWENAQTEEITHHIHSSLENSFNFYNNLYQNYFRYLDIEKDLKGKTIIEIGPARISALLFCENYGQSYIVEPTKYDEANSYYTNLPINFINEPYETCDSPIVDEIWMLNLLQHVLDPDAIVEKAKKCAKTIKFFEPIYTPIEPYHPHTFTLDDYVKYFGDCTKHYGGNITSFHMAECAYGVYQTS